MSHGRDALPLVSYLAHARASLLVLESEMSLSTSKFFFSSSRLILFISDVVSFSCEAWCVYLEWSTVLSHCPNLESIHAPRTAFEFSSEHEEIVMERERTIHVNKKNIEWRREGTNFCWSSEVTKMNASVMLPSQVAPSSPPTKRQRSVHQVQHVLPGELISAEPGYLRYGPHAI